MKKIITAAALFMLLNTGAAVPIGNALPNNGAATCILARSAVIDIRNFTVTAALAGAPAR